MISDDHVVQLCHFPAGAGYHNFVDAAVADFIYAHGIFGDHNRERCLRCQLSPTGAGGFEFLWPYGRRFPPPGYGESSVKAWPYSPFFRPRWSAPSAP